MTEKKLIFVTPKISLKSLQKLRGQKFTKKIKGLIFVE